MLEYACIHVYLGLPCASPVNFFPPAGNSKKSASILQKALTSNAKPVELLQMAIKNLKAGKTQLVPAENKENLAGQFTPGGSLIRLSGGLLYDQKFVDTWVSQQYVFSCIYLFFEVRHWCSFMRRFVPEVFSSGFRQASFLHHLWQTMSSWGPIFCTGTLWGHVGSGLAPLLPLIYFPYRFNLFRGLEPISGLQMRGRDSHTLWVQLRVTSAFWTV